MFTIYRRNATAEKETQTELHANVRRMDDLASYRAKHYIEIVLLAS